MNHIRPQFSAATLLSFHQKPFAFLNGGKTKPPARRRTAARHTNHPAGEFTRLLLRPISSFTSVTQRQAVLMPQNSNVSSSR